MGFWNPICAQDKSSKVESERLFEKAGALMGVHRTDEALRTLDAAIRLNPRRCYLYSSKANWLINLDRLAEARRAVATALRLDANDADTHAANALLLLRLKRFPEAVRESRRAIALNPREVSFRDTKVACLIAQGDLKGAFKEVSEALAMAPKNAHLHSDKAHILLRASLVKEALEEISKAIELDPIQEYFVLRSRILLDLKRPLDAEMDITRALRIGPNSEECQKIRLRCLCDQKKFPSAASCLIKLLSNNKEHIDDKFICSYVRQLSTSGGKAEALEVINRAIEEKGVTRSPELNAARIGLYCSLGDDLKVKEGVAACLEKSHDPARDGQLIQSTILSYRPWTILHSMALEEVEHVLESFSRSKHLSETEQRKIDAFIPKLNASQDNLLAFLCTNCTSEGEAFSLVTITGGIKRQRHLSEGLYDALTQLQIRSANLSEALAWVSDGLKIYPNSVKLLELRANLHATLGRKQQVQMDVEQVQRRGQASFTEEIVRENSRNIVAQFSSILNDDEQAARQALEPALKRQREKLLAATTLRERAADLLALAELEIVGKNYVEALKQTQESIKLDGNNARAYELSSWALQGLNKYPEASEARRMALKLFSKH